MTAFAPLPETLTEELQTVRDWIQGNPREAVKAIAEIDDMDVRDALQKDWRLWRREDQPTLRRETLAAEIDRVLLLCGRSWGKTRWVAEFLLDYARNHPGHRVGLLGKTREDIKKVIIEGDSGLLNCMSKLEREQLHYDKVALDITFPNGCKLFGLPADRPEKMRGPQFHLIVSDELCKYQYADEVMQQISMCLRLGDRPLAVFATTPKPTAAIKDLANDPRTLVIQGPSFNNHFLTAAYFERMKQKLTQRMYRQEVLAEILEDNPNALFQQKDVDRGRLTNAMLVPPLDRVIVGVDPAVTAHEESDETGIVTAGVCEGADGRKHYYILADSSVHAARPKQWAQRVVDAYNASVANKVVAEVNNGGDMVESTIHSVSSNVPVKQVRATRGKAIRAEPVAALYEQGLVHHVGVLGELETQMTEWDPVNDAKSPDRMDAMVWALTELMEGGAEFSLRPL